MRAAPQLEPLPATRFLPAASLELAVPRDDGARFDALMRALDAADVPPPEARELWRATAACLHLGAIQFGGAGGDEDGPCVPTAGSRGALGACARLLGCDGAALGRALTLKQIKAGPDWIEKANPPAVCLELCGGLATPIMHVHACTHVLCHPSCAWHVRGMRRCDGLAKATYSRLFAWLQAQLTAALAAHTPHAAAADERSLVQARRPTLPCHPPRPPSLEQPFSPSLEQPFSPSLADERALVQAAPLSIGLLDIFGFESFARNSLEQARVSSHTPLPPLLRAFP